MSYFSNGTEGQAWTSVWCDTCTRDHGMHPGHTIATAAANGSGDGCAIFLRALVGETVPEWSQREGAPFVLPPDVICHSYDPCLLDACTGDPQPAARAGARGRVAEHHRERFHVRLTTGEAAGHWMLCAATYGQACDMDCHEGAN